MLSRFWRLEASDQGASRAGFFSGLPLCLVDSCLHVILSVCTCVLSSSSYKDISRSRWIRAHPYDFIYLNYPFKVPISKYSHSVRSWVLGLKRIYFNGDIMHHLLHCIM